MFKQARVYLHGHPRGRGALKVFGGLLRTVAPPGPCPGTGRSGSSVAWHGVRAASGRRLVAALKLFFAARRMGGPAPVALCHWGPEAKDQDVRRARRASVDDVRSAAVVRAPRAGGNARAGWAWGACVARATCDGRRVYAVLSIQYYAVLSTHSTTQYSGSRVLLRISSTTLLRTWLAVVVVASGQQNRTKNLQAENATQFPSWFPSCVLIQSY